MPAFTANGALANGAFQDPMLNIKIAKKLNAERSGAASIKSSASIKTASSTKTEAPQFFTSPLTSNNMYL
ncbi:UNVERIFIED_CONTAM: hypothetical protein HDU68_010730 [Siphonaria sp. JEL0065]|nr:hypothetical protein HDU68_010730 [Siphonaria sp. JEL0065]